MLYYAHGFKTNFNIIIIQVTPQLVIISSIKEREREREKAVSIVLFDCIVTLWMVLSLVGCCVAIIETVVQERKHPFMQPCDFH